MCERRERGWERERERSARRAKGKRIANKKTLQKREEKREKIRTTTCAPLQRMLLRRSKKSNDLQQGAQRRMKGENKKRRQKELEKYAKKSTKRESSFFPSAPLTLHAPNSAQRTQQRHETEGGEAGKKMNGGKTRETGEMQCDVRFASKKNQTCPRLFHFAACALRALLRATRNAGATRARKNCLGRAKKTMFLRKKKYKQTVQSAPAIRGIACALRAPTAKRLHNTHTRKTAPAVVRC